MTSRKKSDKGPAPAPKGFDKWDQYLPKRGGTPAERETPQVEVPGEVMGAGPAREVSPEAGDRAVRGDDVAEGNYRNWFEELTGHAPRGWQERLGAQVTARSRVVRIPTGYGKTLGVLGAWLYHRVERSDERWPRRLVWALPMRTLVEQTAEVVRSQVQRLGVLWDPRDPEHAKKVGVHLLMGGADQGGDWNLHPEECAVLIGTQDMLLSRALNRGYAAGRARWPLEFGLLSHDALWVLDEVQLMDVGLATTAQLQAFFDEDASRGQRPRVSWWMSATLQTDWLRSVDTESRHATWVEHPITLDAAEQTTGLAAIPKSLSLKEIPANEAVKLADLCIEAHASLEDGEHGRITLVVCNTVARARETHQAIEKRRVASQLELVHGRFRPFEREMWRSRFLERSACRSGTDRIIVATQVVEAGVDISAGCVVTELAPWSSLVQRFGRCARYGGDGRVIVVDRGRDEPIAAPYAPEQLEGALAALKRLTRSGVGIASLEAFEASLDDDGRRALYPYHPEHLLLRRELDELFDTTPDLTGGDVDVSRFIRTGEERDVSVFWLDLPKPKKGEPLPIPPSSRRPERRELCSVPFLAAQEWLCGKASKTDRKPRLRSGVRAWTWDFLDGCWEVAQRADMTPGRVLCVAADVGGYTPARGFDPESDAAVLPVPPELSLQQQAADDLEDSELLSASLLYKTIATHDREVGELAARIAAAVGLPVRLAELLGLAGRWHDLGKAHPAFQSLILGGTGRPDRQDLAKAPQGCWGKRYRAPDGERRGFRHELASCLALFDVLRRYAPNHAALLGPWAETFELLSIAAAPAAVADASSASRLEREVLACTAEEFDLLAYLVLAHHGKVRASMNAGPKDQDFVAGDARGLPIRGVRDGDMLPGIELDVGEQLPELRLTLAPAALGLSHEAGRSWRERTLALQRHHGPGALAWLEALLIAADRRASQCTTPDPLLAESGGS